MMMDYKLIGESQSFIVTQVKNIKKQEKYKGSIFVINVSSANSKYSLKGIQIIYCSIFNL